MMFRPRRRLELVLAALTIAAVLLLRWRFPDQEQMLQIAVAEENGAVLREAAQEFSGQHKEIQIQLDQNPYDEVHDRVFASVNETERGIRYDVVMVDHPWIKPLRNRLAPLEAADISQFPESVLRPARCPGSSDPRCLLGIPYVGNSELFVINRRVLPGTKWPADWGSVLGLASQSRAPYYAYALRAKFDDESSVTDEFMPFYWAYRNGRTNTFAAAAAAAHTLQSLAARSPLPIGVYGSSEVSALLLQGKIAMGITWSDWAMRMADADPQAVQDLEFGLPPGGQPELGIWLMSIPKNAPHPEAAEEFVRFATRPDALKRAATKSNPPARLDLFDDPELAARYPSFGAQRASLIAARERPAKQDWHGCSETKIAQALSGLYFGEMDLTAASEEIREALDGCK
jgi:multiple sugar transport system substrate-binding protein